MKKQATIFFITICIATSLAFSQNTENKKRKYCSVRLIRMDGYNEKFILGGFSKDSIWGYSFANSEEKKVVRPGKPVFVGSSDIKKVFIKIEKGFFPPGKWNDSVNIKKFNSSLVTDNLKNTAINSVFFDGIGNDAFTLFSFPELGVLFLAADFLFPPKGKWYYIKGKEKRFDRMMKKFVTKKESDQND